MARNLFVKRAPTLVDSPYVTEWLRTVDVDFASDVINFNDASPVSVFMVPANTLVDSVMVQVVTAFNGSLASVSLGKSGTVSQLVNVNDFDPTTVGLYPVMNKPILYVADTQLIATISAGAAAGSTGQLVFWLGVRPNTTFQIPRTP